MKDIKCPIFKATGKHSPKGISECEVCPFTAKCPEDMASDFTVKVLEEFGKYLDRLRKGEKNESDKARIGGVERF